MGKGMKDLYEFENNFAKYQDVESELVVEGKINDPKISIFIPTYNRYDTLELTLKSALSQKTSIVYEVVVVCNNPDGKSDKTRELIDSFCDDRIYYYVNKENIGLCGNWNRGIELSRADYISMIHDDDLLSPYFIDNIYESIEINNNPGIIGVDYVTFDSNNLPTFQQPEQIKYRKVTKQSFFFGKYINIAGMTVNKRLAKNLGGYSDDYYPNEDTNMIYQALIVDSVINVEVPLAGYRKEVNLSLKEGTMEQIVTLMEKTRRNIAQHERFASEWMRRYDKEFLYLYITNANQNWNLNIDYRKIFDSFGFDKKPSQIKMIMMKIQLRLMKYRNIA